MAEDLPEICWVPHLHVLGQASSLGQPVGNLRRYLDLGVFQNGVLDQDRTCSKQELRVPSLSMRRCARSGFRDGFELSPLSLRSEILPMIGLHDLMNDWHLLLGLVSSRARVRARGGLLVGNDLRDGCPTLLSLPYSFGFTLPFSFPSIEGAFRSRLAHEFERVDQRSHFRNLTERNEVRYVAWKTGRCQLGNK